MRGRGWIRRYRFLVASAAALVSVLLAGPANWPKV
jgi:hypothetical protein